MALCTERGNPPASTQTHIPHNTCKAGRETLIEYSPPNLVYSRAVPLASIKLLRSKRFVFISSGPYRDGTTSQSKSAGAKISATELRNTHTHRGRERERARKLETTVGHRTLRLTECNCWAREGKGKLSGGECDSLERTDFPERVLCRKPQKASARTLHFTPPNGGGEKPRSLSLLTDCLRGAHRRSPSL